MKVLLFFWQMAAIRFVPVDFTEGTKKYVMNINMATQQIQAEFTDMSAGVVEDTSMGALLKTATVYTPLLVSALYSLF